SRKFDVFHPRLRQHRKRHNRDFPKIGLKNPADTFLGIFPRPHGSKTDREPIKSPASHEFAHFPRPTPSVRQAAANEQSSLVFADIDPSTDWLVRIMLKQHPHATCS